jgi:hypothetical protein
MKKLQILLLLVFGLTFMTSCGDDVDCSDEAAAQAELEPLLDAVITATFAYGLDPSADNCKAAEDAIDALIDKTKEYEDCADSAAEFQEAIDDLEAAKDDLGC